MVTISACSISYMPTVIIERIRVLLHGAEVHSCSCSNSLFVDYWQNAGACQQHIRELASLSVESHHEGWLTFPPLLPIFFCLFSLAPHPPGVTVQRHPQAQCWQETSWELWGQIEVRSSLRKTWLTLTFPFHEFQFIECQCKIPPVKEYKQRWFIDSINWQWQKDQEQHKWNGSEGKKERTSNEKRFSCLDLLRVSNLTLGD